MKLAFEFRDQRISLEADARDGRWLIRLPDGRERILSVRRLSDDVVEVVDGDRAFRVPFVRGARGIELSFEGGVYAFEEESSPRTRAGVGRPDSGVLTAPMFGTVADVLVSEGDSVQAYQPLVVVEAMKVMATVESPFAGRVMRVHVSRLQRVEQGAPLVELTPVEE